MVAGALSTAEVAQLSAFTHQLIDDQSSEGVDQREGTTWIKSLLEHGQIAELARNQRVLSTVGKLLGEPARPTSAVMRDPVGPGAQQALHVDLAGPITPGNDQLAQALFYLDDVTLDNGPTRVVPSTHNIYAVPDRRYESPIAHHPDERLITCSAGDVLVFSSHLWHSGTGNHSGKHRRTITVSYSR